VLVKDVGIYLVILLVFMFAFSYWYESMTISLMQSDKKRT